MIWRLGDLVTCIRLTMASITWPTSLALIFGRFLLMFKLGAKIRILFSHLFIAFLKASSWSQVSSVTIFVILLFTDITKNHHHHQHQDDHRNHHHHHQDDHAAHLSRLLILVTPWTTLASSASSRLSETSSLKVFMMATIRMTMNLPRVCSTT